MAGHAHPIFACLWVRCLGQGLDDRGMVAYRRELVAELSGRVLEVGAGDGRNLAHYPATVDEVVAIEPEPNLREALRERASGWSFEVTVVGAVAEALPCADASFDAAVVSLALCSVDDQATALQEMRRVLRAEGELRFLEHVVAARPGPRRVQRVLDATVWPRLGAGCHTARDTVGSVRAAGFDVASLRRFAFPESSLSVPTAPHVLGRAVRG